MEHSDPANAVQPVASDYPTLITTGAKLAIEFWKALRAFDRAIPLLPIDQQRSIHAQLRFGRGRLDSLLSDIGLKLATFDGQPYGPGLPASVINADEVDTDDCLVVTQTVEPAVISGDRVLLTGRVIVGNQQKTKE